MSAEIVRRRDAHGGHRLRLDVVCDTAAYHVLITPARGMNAEVVGYRVQIAGRLHPSPEHAEAAAILAIERLANIDHTD